MRSCEARPETCSSILSSRSTKRLIHDDSTANKLQKMRKHNERMRFMPVVDDFFRVFGGQKIKEDEPKWFQMSNCLYIGAAAEMRYNSFKEYDSAPMRRWK
jgi:hypothetical protein